MAKQSEDEVGRLQKAIFELAHETNNAIAAIVTYATLIRDDSSADDTRFCDAQEVLSAADRAKNATYELLKLSGRLPAGE